MFIQKHVIDGLSRILFKRSPRKIMYEVINNPIMRETSYSVYYETYNQLYDVSSKETRFIVVMTSHEVTNSIRNVALRSTKDALDKEIN